MTPKRPEQELSEKLIKFHNPTGFIVMRNYPDQLRGELEVLGTHRYGLAKEGQTRERRGLTPFTSVFDERRKLTNRNLIGKFTGAVSPESQKIKIEEEMKKARKIRISHDRRAYDEQGGYADRRKQFQDLANALKNNSEFKALVTKYIPKKGSSLTQRILTANYEFGGGHEIPISGKTRGKINEHLMDFLQDVRQLALKEKKS
ncbi:hypothetical protein HY989_00985 [Candidatus Micrarchaeota archaeon]|nr:hypothetical protein [Candidatus Micrarchaeota archaeon]